MKAKAGAAIRLVLMRLDSATSSRDAVEGKARNKKPCTARLLHARLNYFAHIQQPAISDPTSETFCRSHSLAFKLSTQQDFTVNTGLELSVVLNASRRPTQ
ncbi:hypothetical protein EYF80_027791 [Liparis tanakae]|uniref:Uncharacterized protein n=1 Tax=Liparis tanakae TaxID=230148 RepID=A0A4Z2H851_9TELE|nr:hypothetical protein EYF80_027791 [Liparis tanakae]